jgi:hypothetical protein
MLPAVFLLFAAFTTIVSANAFSGFKLYCCVNSLDERFNAWFKGQKAFLNRQGFDHGAFHSLIL